MLFFPWVASTQAVRNDLSRSLLTCILILYRVIWYLSYIDIRVYTWWIAILYIFMLNKFCLSPESWNTMQMISIGNAKPNLHLLGGERAIKWFTENWVQTSPEKFQFVDISYGNNTSRNLTYIFSPKNMSLMSIWVQNILIPPSTFYILHKVIISSWTTLHPRNVYLHVICIIAF